LVINKVYTLNLDKEKKLKLEQLNRKFISEENCLRIAEELKKNTQYGEKVGFFKEGEPIFYSET
jgi:precorrin-2 methylase